MAARSLSSSFCEMYTDPQKRFRPRSEAEILEGIRRCGQELGGEVRRVFLADGDALSLSSMLARERLAA